jgi:ACT domain-containing protein
MINTTAKSTLARLLAKENITVREGNFRTASFDVVNRVLNLPLWKDRGKDVYDLLIGHEVGHALYTPADGWHGSEIDVEGIPRAYLNIIEDIRIERAIQATYPGLVGSFKRAYKVLFEENFFGTQDEDVNTYGLPDRINVRAKLGDLSNVIFDASEKAIVDECFGVKTWEDVVVAARNLYNFVNENKLEDPRDYAEADSDNSNEGNDEQNGTEDFPSENKSEDRNDQNESQDQSGGSESSSEDSEEDGTEEERSESVSGSEAEESGEEDEGEEDDALPAAPTKREDDAPAEEVEVKTDAAFRRNEANLLEGIDAWNRQPLAVAPITKSDIRNVPISYKEVFASRDVTKANTPEQFFEGEEGRQEFGKFMEETKRVVATMVKEFEMRKAAFRYSRSKTSKSGSLDMAKLHSYKYNDDVFARNTVLADSKNHGMVMLVDNSGSMGRSLPAVQRQVINLAMFCKKTNIPFQVFGFTSGSNYMPKQEEFTVDFTRVRLFELVSSEMSRVEFDRAIRDLWFQSYELSRHNYGWHRPHCGEVEDFGGTPLNECLLWMNEYLPMFRAKYGLDKVNFTVLTDGDAQRIGYTYDYRRKDKENAVDFDPRRMSVSMNGKRKVIGMGSSGTKDILDAIRGNGITTIGYFIPDNNWEFKNRCYSCGVNSEEELRETRKEYNRQKFVNFDKVLGFDRYFILKSGRAIDTANEGFDVKEGAKKGELTRQFKKFAGSKKGNRILVSRFAEMVA